jgi:hypothetical protein
VLAARGAHAADDAPVAGLEALDLLLEDALDAEVGQALLDDLGSLFTDALAPPAVAAHQVLRVGAVGAEDDGQVDAEQAGADDDGLIGVLGLALEVPGVLQGPEGAHALGVPVGHREPAGGAARGDEELVEGVSGAVVADDALLVLAHVRRPGARSELDVALAVELLVVHHEVVTRLVPLGQVLGSDPVVEGDGLVRDHRDVAGGILLADLLGRGRPGDAVADDHILPGHLPVEAGRPLKAFSARVETCHDASQGRLVWGICIGGRREEETPPRRHVGRERGSPTALQAHVDGPQAPHGRRRRGARDEGSDRKRHDQAGSARFGHGDPLPRGLGPFNLWATPHRRAPSGAGRRPRAWAGPPRGPG